MAYITSQIILSGSYLLEILQMKSLAYGLKRGFVTSRGWTSSHQGNRFENLLKENNHAINRTKNCLRALAFHLIEKNPWSEDIPYMYINKKRVCITYVNKKTV